MTAEPDTTRTRLTANILTALADENTRLRRGLQQIIDGDYPAEAGNAETWAAELLADPAAVDWEDEPEGAP